MTRPRILVVGTGGIGGTIAGNLLRHHTGDRQPHVVGLTRNPAIASAIAKHGYRLGGTDGKAVVRGTMIASPSQASGVFDWIFLATQPPHMEEAARSVAHLLAPDGAMVVLQNGLPEARIAKIVGPDRVVGAIVGWGASMPEPGLFERTSAGGFTLGCLYPMRGDSLQPGSLRTLATLLEVIGPVKTTSNLRGARWSKLAINCAISTLGTIGGDRFGPLVAHRVVRTAALEIFTEAAAVARAEGVAFEKLGGTIDISWIALTDAERATTMGSPSLFAKHSLILAAGARYRRMRSSMLAAIERGREPAVDFLNGELVDRARSHGIAVPVNAAAQRMVHRIARGEATSSVDSVRSLLGAGNVH